METVDHYREILLDHGKHPRNSVKLEHADLNGSCKNPICGDHVSIAMNLDENQIVETSIQAMGCTISVASASLMSDLIKGKSQEQVLELVETLRESFVDLSSSSWPDSLAALKPLSRLRQSPTRIPCAMIGWLAAADAIRNARSTV